MNDAEQDMRIIQLEERVTHLAQDSSSTWASLGNLSRQLITLRHRLYLLEQKAKVLGGSTMSEHQQEPFPVLSISREDVTRAMGYNPDVQLTDYQLQSAELTDEDMRVLAGKLSNALSEIVSEVGFWKVLADVVESWLEIENENNKGD